MAPSKGQPALLGGAFIGILSALPIVSAGNLCCCLWVVAGGMVAAYLMQQNHHEPISLADGAGGGFLAGLAGAVVYLVASIPVNLALGPFQRRMMDRMMSRAGDVPPEMRTMIEQMGAGAGALIVGFVAMLFAGMVFATVGGVVGALIFRPNAPPPPPPPPPPAPPVEVLPPLP
jgi:hypothetical protein